MTEIDHSPCVVGPLVERARAGDMRAFEALYRQHVGRVHGLCLRMVRNPDVAEDCTQQTFINAWRSLPAFEQRSAFGTWLHRIAVNVVLSRQPRQSSDFATSRGDSTETDGNWVFETPVEVGEIEEAIGTLPAGARDVLVLSGLYGYSHAETASMLGIAEGTCKAQLHRARQLLRQRLGLEDGTDG
jgi:RNA polymerase sigma-70 factor, ECF subfamily